jgi:hypothetical protein
MNASWIILGVGVVRAILAMIGWSQRQSDLGFMSHHWVAEHRLSHTDPQR